MTLPISEQIIANIFAALQALGASLTPPANVERDRDEPVAKFPTILLEDRAVGEEFSLEQAYAATCSMDVEVEAYLQGATGAVLGPALEALKAQIHNAVVADRRRGGIAIDTQIKDALKRIWTAAQGGTPTASVAITFTVTYQTAPDDFFSLPGAT